ncbi:hypothetical protein K443DRAFT_452945 [Laccaria amethystina LaAM-08-1]|jgi:hypothetical protein|uniref:Uncharacterized protein n=1 Tax=Laccaria amethystina LaAM-08-1 TaxID=1095629 RepID=A0A0C9Y5N5_9AGAR|nr:hypothetical protein K443DRAFT_452945 [Laccaria amethystina LaAM-08-1]
MLNEKTDEAQNRRGRNSGEEDVGKVATDGAGCVLEERAGMVVDKFLPALIPFRIHTNGSPIAEMRVQALGRLYVSSFDAASVIVRSDETSRQ